MKQRFLLLSTLAGCGAVPVFELIGFGSGRQVQKLVAKANYHNGLFLKCFGDVRNGNVAHSRVAGRLK
jgi:hypothetical protein